MPETADVAIVGGGATGCSVAYHLAKAGVGATIIEREGVGSQASGYSAGGLNPLQGAGIPGPLGPLAIESFRMHRAMWDALQTESGVTFHPEIISMVKVAFEDSETPELEETREIFDCSTGFSAHWMDARELHDLEPRIASDAIRALYTHGNAALDSYLYTVALSGASERMGASIRESAATGLQTSGRRATAVQVQDGAIECNAVVIATGPWSSEAEEWLAVSVPVEPLKGEILRMSLPGQEPLAHDFSWGQVSLFHRADDLIWVGATEESRGYDREPSDSARRSMLEGATRLMPAMSEARLVKHTACLRPLAPDWLPIIGRAPGWDNVYLATGAGKKGILLSPAMGKAIADLITQGRTGLPIADFAPERFVTPL